MNPSDAPSCHLCGAAPLYQWARRANQNEAEQQKTAIARLQGRMLTDAEITERYGSLRVAVTGCGMHHLGTVPHDPDGGLDRRALLHNADCAGHGSCTCVPGAKVDEQP